MTIFYSKLQNENIILKVLLISFIILYYHQLLISADICPSKLIIGSIVSGYPKTDTSPIMYVISSSIGSTIYEITSSPLPI